MTTFKITVRLEALGDRLRFDFTGTDPQVKGPLNAPVGVSFGGVNPRTNRNFVFYESYNGGLGLLREYEMLADRAMKKIPANSAGASSAASICASSRRAAVVLAARTNVTTPR